MKKVTLALVLLAGLALEGNSSAQTNVATDGTAILGFNTGADLSLTGTSYQHSNTGGQFSDLNDGITVSNAGAYTSTDDTYGAGAPYSYVGIMWNPTQLAPIANDSITSLNLYLHIFGDGGWFGQRDQGLVGGQITAAELVVPQVQIFNGTTWSNVASSTNYGLDTTQGGLAGQPGNADTAGITFTLDTPINLGSIEGIRLIGLGGGTASDGFLGVNELQVIAEAPEPSTYAMLFAGLGMLAFGLHFSKNRAS